MVDDLIEISMACRRIDNEGSITLEDTSVPTSFEKCFTASAWRAVSLEAMMTFAMSCLNSSVMKAAAIPSLPPVTTATLPANEGILDALQGLRTLWMIEAMVVE